MLAQAGIPLTGGFIAKLEVFSAATDAREYALVAIGAVATVVASFAYLRVVLAVARPDTAEEEAASGCACGSGTGSTSGPAPCSRSPRA